MDSARVLIVDNNPDKVDKLSRLLQFDSNLTIIGSESSGAEAREIMELVGEVKERYGVDFFR